MLEIYQSAHTRHHIIEISIQHIINNKRLNKHLPYQFLFLDLSAAFDNIDYEMFIKRLIDIGILYGSKNVIIFY